MKVVILAGGYGTRISEITDHIPKPMIELNNIPIMIHIMDHYSKHGFNDFIIAAGYKANYIKEYFLNFFNLSNDFKVNLIDGSIEVINKKVKNWSVSVIDTGLDTLTGSRIKKLEKLLHKERFFLTYGDGLSDVNITNLLKSHIKNKKIATVTAVHPVARFGELNVENSLVSSFEEKPQLNEGWINGGYFVFEPEFFKFLPNKNVMLERDPLTKLVSNGELSAYKHEGFWHCMDSKRDFELLKKLAKLDKVPWQT